MGSTTLNVLWEDFISAFFPNCCSACDETIYTKEEGLCLTCASTLPFTNFHDDLQSPVYKSFWGRVKIEGATALFWFNGKTRVQTLIHKLKYKNTPKIGILTGEILGSQLVNSPIFSTATVVVPVPLHPAKKRKRGYNQAEMIAIGIANSMDIQLDSKNLIRVKNTNTQTKKSREERVENVKNVFQALNQELFINQHVLLVDDVMTTGSTLESCVLALANIENIKISVATIAYAE